MIDRDREDPCRPSGLSVYTVYVTIPVIKIIKIID